MILFILIAIGIALYTIFADGWLIDCIKNIEETNKKVKENIKYGRTNYGTFSFRKYDEHDYESVPKDILYWIIYNISFCFLLFSLCTFSPVNPIFPVEKPGLFPRKPDFLTRKYWLSSRFLLWN